MTNVLEIKNLKKNYYTEYSNTEAIKDFTYTVKEGEMIAIVGPSGCGKSTILSILAGLIKDYDGCILNNKDIKFGYMMQNDNLFDFRTIYENCLLGQEIEKKKDPNYVLNLLEKYGLNEFTNSLPKNLSGGMRQRVA